jgi:hypothetical protein
VNPTSRRQRKNTNNTTHVLTHHCVAVQQTCTYNAGGDAEKWGTVGDHTARASTLLLAETLLGFWKDMADVSQARYKESEVRGRQGSGYHCSRRTLSWSLGSVLPRRAVTFSMRPSSRYAFAGSVDFFVRSVSIPQRAANLGLHQMKTRFACLWLPESMRKQNNRMLRQGPGMLAFITDVKITL